MISFGVSTPQLWLSLKLVLRVAEVMAGDVNAGTNGWGSVGRRATVTTRRLSAI